MKERILQIMAHEQLGQAQFAAAIGIQRAGVSHILSGRNKPSLEVVQKILTRFPKLNPDWLLTGQGELKSPRKNRKKTVLNRRKNNRIRKRT